MNNELKFLMEKHTDTLIEPTRTRPQETLEFKMENQMEKVSFSTPINLVEEGKGLSGVSSFECTNSIFNITNEHNLLSFTVPGTKTAEKSLDELN